SPGTMGVRARRTSSRALARSRRAGDSEPPPTASRPRGPRSMHTAARMLFFVALSALAFGLISPLPPVTPGTAHAAGPPPGPRVVYLARELSDECLLSLTSAVAGAVRGGVVLLDSEKLTGYTRAFLADFKPERVVPVGSFPDGIAALNRRLEIKAASPLNW